MQVSVYADFVIDQTLMVSGDFVVDHTFILFRQDFNTFSIPGFAKAKQYIISSSNHCH